MYQKPTMMGVMRLAIIARYVRTSAPCNNWRDWQQNYVAKVSASFLILSLTIPRMSTNGQKKHAMEKQNTNLITICSLTARCLTCTSVIYVRFSPNKHPEISPIKKTLNSGFGL